MSHRPGEPSGTDTDAGSAPSSAGALDSLTATSEVAPPSSSVSPDVELTSAPPRDECPAHPDESEAGSCGCGHAPDPICEALTSALAHRYSFVSKDVASSVADSAGDADALIFGGHAANDGAFVVDGAQSYVSLPQGVLSSRPQSTLDLWVVWWGGSENQRMLNFGREPEPGESPNNYLSVSPRSSDGVLAVQFRTNREDRGERLDADFPLVTDSIQHLTLVVEERQLRLYVNGTIAAEGATGHRLMDLRDENNWLGRALFSDYPSYNGALYEFRIFERALTESEVKKLDQVGLDLPTADGT